MKNELLLAKNFYCLQCTKCKQSFIHKGYPSICPLCECGIEFVTSPEAKYFPVDNGGEEIINAKIRLEQAKVELLIN